MNLFVVKRFHGEDNIEAKAEENQLSEVLDKISKRKKRKLKAKLKKLTEIENTFDDKLKSDRFKHVDDTQEDNKQEKNEFTLPDKEDDDKLVQNEPESKKAKISDSKNIEGFTILGTDQFEKRPHIKRILPKWLRNPTIISTNMEKLSDKISLTEIDERLKTKLKENNIKYLFPVQAGFIPWQLNKSKQVNLLKPPDACVSAPTGSGKTLAFVIPLLQDLIDRLNQRNMTMKAVRALLVLPTHSLAVQIYNTFKSYTVGTKITIGIITSAETTFKIEQKLLVTNNSVWGSFSRCDVLICTAGRLIDHLKNTKGFDLKHLEYIIIDEADRVLDSMQDDWLRHLNIHLRSEGNKFVDGNILTLSSVKKRTDPQKLLFSATLTSDPEKLQKLSLFQPKLFTCIANNEDINGKTENADRFFGKYTLPDKLEEKYVVCTVQNKPLTLYKLILDVIKNTESPKIIVFVNEQNIGHRLSLLMCLMGKKAFIVKELSDLTHKPLKKEILVSFSSGKINVLICTNLMARGIDIPNVDCVISYCEPTHIKTYVHRAGRTARGGTKGIFITMVETHRETKFFKMLENIRPTNILQKIEYNADEFETLSSLYKKSLEQLKFKVHKEKQNRLLKTKHKKHFFTRKPMMKKNSDAQEKK